ncbi:MAG: serine/threonine protein kinase, partial [Isosphaeraceae bacterium]|nr:serine/threonine protein kinase [Isosphaeraceae bacterium]
MIDDADETRLDDLLTRWGELRERGQSTTVEDLCSDCPELADELGRRIAALRGLDSTLDASQMTSDPCKTASIAGARPRTSASSRADYQDLRFHAEGGLGEVFKARHVELNREVALKFLKPERARDPDSRRRFLLEAEVTGRLEHPGIVPVYGLGHDADGHLCYAMRFIRGQTLREAISAFHAADAPGRDPSERALALRGLLHRFITTCNTIAYAHSRGVVHRDLKPRNILLGQYDETLVVDWGLAKPFARGEDARASGEETLTPTPHIG